MPSLAIGVLSRAIARHRVPLACHRVPLACHWLAIGVPSRAIATSSAHLLWLARMWSSLLFGNVQYNKFHTFHTFLLLAGVRTVTIRHSWKLRRCHREFVVLFLFERQQLPVKLSATSSPFPKPPVFVSLGNRCDRSEVILN